MSNQATNHTCVRLAKMKGPEYERFDPNHLARVVFTTQSLAHTTFSTQPNINPGTCAQPPRPHYHTTRGGETLGRLVKFLAPAG